MGIRCELDMLDMVQRRNHSRLTTLASAASRDWPSARRSYRSCVRTIKCYGHQKIEGAVRNVMATTNRRRSFGYTSGKTVRLPVFDPCTHAIFPIWTNTIRDELILWTLLLLLHGECKSNALCAFYDFAVISDLKVYLALLQNHLKLNQKQKPDMRHLASEMPFFGLYCGPAV